MERITIVPIRKDGVADVSTIMENPALNSRFMKMIWMELDSLAVFYEGSAEAIIGSHVLHVEYIVLHDGDHVFRLLDGKILRDYINTPMDFVGA